MKLRSLLLVAAAGVLVGSGCGRALPVAADAGPQPAATSGFNAKVIQVEPSASPSDEPSPVPTETPTPTPAPPESTPTPVPPTPVPATPTPAPEPAGYLFTWSGAGTGTSPEILWPAAGGYFADLSFNCPGGDPALVMAEWATPSGSVTTGAQTATFHQASHAETEEYPYPQPGSTYGGRYLHIDATGDCSWSVVLRQRG